MIPGNFFNLLKSLFEFFFLNGEKWHLFFFLF